MTIRTRDAFVTPQPWPPSLQHPIYATPDTYLRAAAWLDACDTVADWGGGTGFFGTCLAHAHSWVVDGTRHGNMGPRDVLADLTTYREPSDGILLRHVLDVTEDWEAVLTNALAMFRQRLVVVTFTPAAPATVVVHTKSGWPVRHFAPADLRAAMVPFLVKDEAVRTSHPEHVYYLDRERAA